MLKLTIISLIIISNALCTSFRDDPLFQKFEEYTLKFQKVYSTVNEFEARFEIFKDNFIKNAFSSESSKGITKNFDLTKEEITSLSAPKRCTTGQKRTINFDIKNLPKTFDWREKGKVTPIKNQSFLDTSFAFSSVGVLESQSLITYNKLNFYSEKQILDCDTDTSHLMQSALLYVEKFGIEGENDYGKQTPKSNETCKYDKTKVLNYVKSVECLENASVDDIKVRLYTIGPLSIGVSSTDFGYYTSGILQCTVNNEMDLGVLLVGYGEDHWIIKNSWGKTWGEGGFARISMTQGKNCGIGQYVVSADLV